MCACGGTVVRYRVVVVNSRGGRLMNGSGRRKTVGNFRGTSTGRLRGNRIKRLRAFGRHAQTSSSSARVTAGPPPSNLDLLFVHYVARRVVQVPRGRLCLADSLFRFYFILFISLFVVVDVHLRRGSPLKTIKDKTDSH